MQVETTAAKTVVTPATTKITMSYSELIDCIRLCHPTTFPQGGMYELKFDPNIERVIIIHT